MPALVTLRDGKTFAASHHEFRDGWLHIHGRRYVKVGKDNEQTRFCGPLGTHSWPREAVAKVRPVDSSDGEPQALLAAPDAS